MIKHKNNYEFKKWAWRKNSKNDLKCITIPDKRTYIPGTNKIYDDYIYRKNIYHNNIYRIRLERDLSDMGFFKRMYERTNDECYLNMYNTTIEHYTSLLSVYNSLYPKRDNIIIYIVSTKEYIYPEDWE